MFVYRNANRDKTTQFVIGLIGELDEKLSVSIVLLLATYKYWKTVSQLADYLNTFRKDDANSQED